MFLLIIIILLLCVFHSADNDGDNIVDDNDDGVADDGEANFYDDDGNYMSQNEPVYVNEIEENSKQLENYFKGGGNKIVFFLQMLF